MLHGTCILLAFCKNLNVKMASLVPEILHYYVFAIIIWVLPKFSSEVEIPSNNAVTSKQKKHEKELRKVFHLIILVYSICVHLETSHGITEHHQCGLKYTIVIYIQFLYTLIFIISIFIISQT